MRREQQAPQRPRGALRTPVSIRLEFAHWKALQDFRTLGLIRTEDDPHEADCDQSSREQ
jgi:hypothetical protein